MRLLSFLIAAGISLFAANAALAQDDYCARLRADLAALGGGGAQTAAAGNTDALRARISAARDRQRAEGCTGGFLGDLFGNGRNRANAGLCSAIRADIARMERELSRSRGASRRWAPRFDFDSFGEDNAALIRQRMEEAGCSTETARSGPNWGPYRTVCVRACDGFYFPISSSAKRGDLEQHAQACQALCPGQQVSLYYYNPSEDDPSNAVSLTGDRYSSSPNAFAYRNSFNPSCGCAPEGGWATVANLYSRAYPRGMLATNSTVEQATLGVPVPRPMPSSDDPETLANRAGAYVVEPVKPIVIGEIASRADPDIRLIGPAFYYAN